jgi:hypothetical protein
MLIFRKKFIEFCIISLILYPGFETGIASMKHMMVVHCWHYLIASSLFYYINSHCYKIATSHKKIAPMLPTQYTLLYKMPSNLKGKNFISKVPGYCPQNTMAFFSPKLDGIKK